MFWSNDREVDDFCQLNSNISGLELDSHRILGQMLIFLQVMIGTKL